MSKRVANKKGKSRVTPARSRVRLGWRKRRMRDFLIMMKAREIGVVEDGEV